RDSSPLPELGRRPDRDGLVAWLRQTRNDLEEPATRLAPPVAEVLAALRANGAHIARMSGSGATCFGIFPTAAAASMAAAAISAARPLWFCVATTSMSRGPVT